MNWGKGIAFTMIAFIGFIVTLVVIMIRQDVELETEDYYQREIAYQEEITSLQNADQSGAKPELSFNDDHLVVQLTSGEFEDVTLNLIRPNDSGSDKSFEIKNTKTFIINKSDLVNGNYAVELHYTVDGKNCMLKDQLYIK